MTLPHSKPHRPTAVTTIAVFWTLSGLANIGVGLYSANKDYADFQYLSNPAVSQWFQFGLPAEFGLYVLSSVFGFVQLVFVYGLVTRRSWSFKLGMLMPGVVVAIGLSFIALYFSAPSNLGLGGSSAGWGLIVAGVFWALVFLKYLRRADVKSYLNVKPGNPSKARGQSTLDVETPQ